MMLRRLKSVDIEQENMRMQKIAKEVVENPPPLPLIKKAEETRTFHFDPTYVLKQDILLPNGQVLHKAGAKVNLLDHMNLERRMFFVDGRDKEQIKWLKAKLQEADRNVANNNEGHVENKVILTAGRIFDITKELKEEINFEEVYFDQEGEITTKLGIKAVPAIAEQEEKRIRITEVDIGEDGERQLPLLEGRSL